MDKKFSVVEDGKTIEYEIVKLCKNNNINYIIYRDKENIYASRYTIVKDNIILDEIIDEKEWDFLDKCLGEINE